MNIRIPKSLFFIPLVLLAAVLTFGFTQDQKQDEPQQFMTITAIESIIPGGLGRSRLFVTDQDGQMIREIKLDNFYSMVGINLGNINNNDRDITGTLNEYIKEGWKLRHVSTGVQSPGFGSDGQKGEGIFLTRYYLSM